MKHHLRAGLALALALGWAASAHAASSGTATVTLAASANAQIQVLDPALTLSPTTTDYDNDYVEAAGGAGLRVRVKSNSTAGLTLLVRCTDTTPPITLADFLIRTQTPPGSPGSSIATYTPIQSTNLTLWSTGSSQKQWLTVTTDVRIQNLGNYGDPAGGGTTNYTNTLAYSVVAL
jgi:hypothetical protein